MDDNNGNNSDMDGRQEKAQRRGDGMEKNENQSHRQIVKEGGEMKIGGGKRGGTKIRGGG